MEFLYDFNALPFYSEQDIIDRERFARAMADHVRRLLLATNPAWTFTRIEAPTLIPRNLVNPNYTNEDLWVQESKDPSRALVLKPETTSSTYTWMVEALRHAHIRPPMCVWQLSKSYRREDDQPTKHCRFKEFYQQEFQCVFTSDSANDYFSAIIENLAQAFMQEVCCPTRLVVSDRLPSYSEKTWDVEVWNSEKWMEVASISLRHDFPVEVQFKSKSVPCKVLEIATSPDRLTYCWNRRLAANPALVLDTTKVRQTAPPDAK